MSVFENATTRISHWFNLKKARTRYGQFFSLSERFQSLSQIHLYGNIHILNKRTLVNIYGMSQKFPNFHSNSLCKIIIINFIYNHSKYIPSEEIQCSQQSYSFKAKNSAESFPLR